MFFTHERRQQNTSPSLRTPTEWLRTQLVPAWLHHYSDRDRQEQNVQTHDLKIKKWTKHSLILNFSVLKMRGKGTIRCRIISEWITMIKWSVNVWRVRCLNRNVSFCSFYVKQAGTLGYFSMVIDWWIKLKMSHQRGKKWEKWTERI